MKNRESICMPLLWRYLLKHSLQTLLLCTGGFVATLLLIRFQEIASLLALQPTLSELLLFILCQIPYILPIALPLSGLIAAFLLTHRLSTSQELTALRACSLPLKQIRSPILLTSLLLATTNFLVVSEITPKARHLSAQLLSSALERNPLVFFHSPKLLGLSKVYTRVEEPHLGKEASGAVIAVKNPSNERLTLMAAKQLKLEEGRLLGREVALLSTLPTEEEEGYDNLIIENQREMVTDASQLTPLLQKKESPPSLLSPQHLSLSSLLASKGVVKGGSKRLQFEVCRRLFFSLISCALPLLGFSLGLHIGRGGKRRGLFCAIFAVALTFTCSIAAKSSHLFPLKMATFYALPFPLLYLLARRHEKRLIKGIE